FDAPAHAARRLWLLVPKWLQGGQHGGGVDVGHRQRAELRKNVIAKRLAPLRATLAVTPAGLVCRNVGVGAFFERFAFDRNGCPRGTLFVLSFLRIDTGD